MKEIEKKKPRTLRMFETSSGRQIVAGKNAVQNEEVVEGAENDEVLLHTAAAGSPFVNCGIKPTKKDIEEAAVFCARYSRDWKQNQKDVEVHVFKKKNVYKDEDMKPGTFGVRKFKVIVVGRGEIEKLKL